MSSIPYLLDIGDIRAGSVVAGDLAIGRSIIEAHRGRIWVERPADGGPGTTVCFTLPLQAPKPARRRRSI